MTAVSVMAATGLLAGFCRDAQAGIEVMGSLYLKNDPRPNEGKIRALPGAGKYTVTSRIGASEITKEFEAFRVDRVDVQRPAELKPGATIPVLKKIMEDYVWLRWDMEAARYLLEAYLKSGQAAEAVKVGNSIRVSNPDALKSPDFLTTFVDAMVANNMDAGVEGILSDAIQKGSRDVAAVAYVKRGNVLKKKGNVKEALVEGFLRATEMFQEQKEAQPEALYQAARCFEELGHGAQAERMRRRLLKEYDGTPWADKMKTGK
jgi:hypothetical protein